MVPLPPGVRLLDVRHRLQHADAQPAIPGERQGFSLGTTLSLRLPRLQVVPFHALSAPTAGVSTTERSRVSSLFGSSGGPASAPCGSHRRLGGTTDLPTQPPSLPPPLRPRFSPRQEPFLAIIIDPVRTCAAGRVEIGAFRTFPEGYTPSGEGQSEYQTIPLNKIEDFGVHANQYYTCAAAPASSLCSAGMHRREKALVRGLSAREQHLLRAPCAGLLSGWTFRSSNRRSTRTCSAFCGGGAGPASLSTPTLRSA